MVVAITPKHNTNKTMVMEAAAHIDTQAKAKQQDTPTTMPSPLETTSTLHPLGISPTCGIQRHQIRQMYNQHTLSCHTSFDCMIEAFNQPQNLNDLPLPHPNLP
jgi:hypothetical protein